MTAFYKAILHENTSCMLNNVCNSTCRGLVSKVSYTLHYNGVSLKPSDVMALNPSLLALSGPSLSQTYGILTASESASTMQYKMLFMLTFGRPPLDVDRDAFENQLQRAWREFKNGN